MHLENRYFYIIDIFVHTWVQNDNSSCESNEGELCVRLNCQSAYFMLSSVSVEFNY